LGEGASLDFFVYFPGKHLNFWLLPLGFFFLWSIFSNPVFLFGALISAAFPLYYSYTRLIPIRMDRERLSAMIGPGEKKIKKERAKKFFQENLEEEKKVQGLEELKEKLTRAQQAEKKAKSELASFDRDLAAMNFRISELEETRKTQEMRVSGLRGENELLHKMVNELREEKKQLKEQILKKN